MADDAADESAALDEVIVTARKKEENLQDVSLSITAVTETEIQQLGLNTVKDVAGLDASLIFDKGYSATDNRIQIRGLSPTRGRSTVAVLIDGIDTTSESIAFGGGSLLATSRLLDLQRVEIVKGPQAALYGRSAFAGAIQYVTKDAPKEFAGELNAEYGDFGRYELSAGFGGPVSENFGLRFNGVYWNDDGVHRNTTTGRKVGYGDGWGAALTANWEASESVDVKARLEFSDDQFGPSPIAQVRSNSRLFRPTEGTPCLTPQGATVALVMGACPTGSARVYAPTVGLFPGGNAVLQYRGAIPDGDDLSVRLDRDTTTGTDYKGTERQVARGSINVNWNVGGGTLSSWTGYTDASFDFDEDGDFDSEIRNGVDVALRAARFDYSNDTKQISQELRFQSDFDGAFNLAVGAQYWKEEADQIARSINIFCIPALPPNVFGPTALPASCGTRSANQVVGLTTGIPRDNGREIESKSVYGLLEFEFASIWRTSFEARYSDEDETIKGTDCDRSVDIPAANAMAPVTVPVPTGSGTVTLPPNFPFPNFQGTRCGDWSLFGSGFQVFGPSVNFLYPSAPPPFGLGLPAFPSQANGATVVLKSGQSYVTPRFTIEAKPTDDLLFYGTWAKAIKPGGISTVAGGAWQDPNYDGVYNETTFDDEKLTEIELGAKMTLADGRLRINPAIFFMDYKDKQVGAQIITPSGIANGVLLNAGAAEIKGFELDADFRPTDNLSFSLNYSYLDAEFTDFRFNSASPTDAVRFGSCPRSAANNFRFCEIDLTGRKLERVPEHSVVALGRYSRPLAALFGSENARWFFELDVQAQGERYIDIWNTSKLDDYVLSNLRLGITSDNWDALIYVNNLGDDDTVLTGNSNPGDVDQALFDPTNFSPADTVGVSLPDPRVVGVRFAYRFGN
jgi:outer membrane receptor protein involved in Fe transport